MKTIKDILFWLGFIIFWVVVICIGLSTPLAILVTGNCHAQEIVPDVPLNIPQAGDPSPIKTGIYDGDIMGSPQSIPINTKSDDVFCCQIKSPEIDYSWSGKQIGLEAGLTTLLFIDYRQTVAIQQEGGTEINKILGPHPNNKRIKYYFEGCEIAQVGTALAFPLIRTPFLGGLIVLEGYTTVRNKMLGFTFKW